MSKTIEVQPIYLKSVGATTLFSLFVVCLCLGRATAAESTLERGGTCL
jgi:hypothetical protein